MTKFESNTIFLPYNHACFTILPAKFVCNYPTSFQLKPKLLFFKSIGWMNGSQSISDYYFLSSFLLCIHFLVLSIAVPRTEIHFVFTFFIRDICSITGLEYFHYLVK